MSLSVSVSHIRLVYHLPLSANLVIFPCNFLQPCANRIRNFCTLSFWLVGKLQSSTLVFFLVDFHYFSALNLLTWHSVREEKWKDWGPRGLSGSLSRCLPSLFSLPCCAQYSLNFQIECCCQTCSANWMEFRGRVLYALQERSYVYNILIGGM